LSAAGLELGGSAMKVLAALVVSIGALVVAPVAAVADSPADNHATYGWIVGFRPTGSYDIAKAPDGSWIKMRGHGTLEAGANRTVTGGGDFIKSDGASGTWMATAVDGFVSYGASTVPGVSGGQAKLQVTLSNGQSGVLTIFCDAPGTKPPEGKEMAEGINLVLGGGVSNAFLTQAGGNTVFLGPGSD
jgi:hypothetical protein